MSAPNLGTPRPADQVRKPRAFWRQLDGPHLLPGPTPLPLSLVYSTSPLTLTESPLTLTESP